MDATKELMSPMHRLIVALLLPACLSACQGYPTGLASPGVALTAAALEGTASLVVTPEWQRHALALVPANTASSIDHLVIRLYGLDGATETELAAVDVLNASKFTAPVGFTRLHAGGRYRVRAFAYQSPGTGQLISDTAGSFADVTVGHDDRPTLAKLRIVLTDVPFDAAATSTGASVVPGGYAAPGLPGALAIARAVTTLAGGTAGYADGIGASARLQGPQGLAIDGAGVLYVADSLNARIRKISAAGAVSTFAGSTPGNADGTGMGAQFVEPAAVALDAMGNLYVADGGGHRIRKITAAGVVTTLAGSGAGYADGQGAGAKFNNPRGVVYGRDGYLYVADCGNHRLRRVSPGGTVTTVAGGAAGFADGTGASARFNGPLGLAVDAAGNVIVADTLNHRLRKVASDGTVSTLAGSGVEGYADGPAATASFDAPSGVALDPLGNLIVADRGNQCLRRVSPTGAVTTVAGAPGSPGPADGPATIAQFSNPGGLAAGSTGDLFVADTGNHRIRKLR